MTISNDVSQVRDWNKALGHIGEVEDGVRPADKRWGIGKVTRSNADTPEDAEKCSDSECDFRWGAIDLIREEVKELEAAVDFDDDVEILDAAADIMFTLSGLIAKAGLDRHLDEVFYEVMRSNWTKHVENPVYDENGKVGKPDTYEPPRIKEIIERHRNFSSNVRR